MNREEWLLEATKILRADYFTPLDASIPTALRMSVGFPGGGSARKRVGEYWQAQACEDETPQIFISPVISDSIEVLGILVHELIHAVHPTVGHKGPFRKLALQLGLEGKMTATKTGENLAKRLHDLKTTLGVEYPHAKINLSDRKKQKTRMIKCECLSCGYIARTVSKWIEEIGAPICPCNNQVMEIEVKEDGSVVTKSYQIKQYQNGKLYDMQQTAYISFCELINLVRSGENVQVICNLTKVDVTRPVCECESIACAQCVPF